MSQRLPAASVPIGQRWSAAGNDHARPRSRNRYGNKRDSPGNARDDEPGNGHRSSARSSERCVPRADPSPPSAPVLGSNRHSDRCTGPLHLPRLRAWALLRRRPAPAAPASTPTSEKPAPKQSLGGGSQTDVIRLQTDTLSIERDVGIPRRSRAAGQRSARTISLIRGRYSRPQ